VSGAQKIVRVEVGGTVGVPQAHVYTHTGVCAHTSCTRTFGFEVGGGVGQKSRFSLPFPVVTYIRTEHSYMFSFVFSYTLKSVQK